MVPERAVDCGELYALERRNFVELERSLGAAELATMVPATPAWSVHDMLSHLVGITADMNALDFGDGADPDAWTLGSGPVAASVAAGRFEMFRSLGGRRSADQIRALSWSGDVDAIVPFVSRYPMPDAAIVE